VSLYGNSVILGATVGCTSNYSVTSVGMKTCLLTLSVTQGVVTQGVVTQGVVTQGVVNPPESTSPESYMEACAI